MKNTIKILKHISAVCIAGVITLCTGIIAIADDTDEYEIVESPVPRKVLVIGDSITTGFGLEGYDKGRDNVQSYANLLKADFKSELTAGEQKFINKGIDGQEATQLLEALKDGKYDSDLKDCDLVLISIGGNDLMHTLFGFFSDNSDYGIQISDLLTDHSVGDLIKALAELSKVLEQRLATYNTTIAEIGDYINEKSDARIIVQTLYNPLDTREKPKLFMAFVRSKINTLNEEILANAKDAQGNERYETADVFAAFAGQGDKLTNINKMDIHPNADGHKLIYETLDSVIRQKTFMIKVEKPKAVEASAQAASDDDNSESSSDKGGFNKLYVIIPAAAAVCVIAVIALKKKGGKE